MGFILWVFYGFNGVFMGLMGFDEFIWVLIVNERMPRPETFLLVYIRFKTN